MTGTNWLIVYKNTRDTYVRQGEVDYLKYAFEDTVDRIALNEKLTRQQAKEYLNGLMPLVEGV